MEDVIGLYSSYQRLTLPIVPIPYLAPKVGRFYTSANVRSVSGSAISIEGLRLTTAPREHPQSNAVFCFTFFLEHISNYAAKDFMVKTVF